MAWSPLQSNSASTAGIASTVTVSYTANVSSGTKLIAAVSVSGSPSVTGAADGTGHSLALLATKRTTDNNVTLWALDTPAGSVGTKPAITATATAGCEMSILIQEVSGLATGTTTAAMIDGSRGTKAGTGGSATGSPFYSSNASNEYLVSVYGDDGGPTWSGPGMMTTDGASVNGSAEANIAIAYGNSSDDEEYASWGMSGQTGDWCVILAAFKLSAGGASYSADATQAFTFAVTASLSGGSASSSRPVLSVLVDWNNDGDFLDAGDDITRRVLLNRSDLTIAYGRDTARALSPVSAGVAAFQVNNISGDYYPDNPASPLAGNLVPGRPVLITGAQNATVYDLYRGFLDDYTPLPNMDDRSVQFSCLDALARFQGVTLSTALYQGIRTGGAISVILDALSWPAALRDLDAGATYYRWWWEESTDALAALLNIVGDEGPPALCFIDPDTGNFCFRDRHHRLQRTASKIPQATLSNGAVAESSTSATYSMPSSYDAGWKNIINAITFASDQRDAQELSVVWQQGSVGTALAGGGVVVSQATPSSAVQVIPSGGVVLITAQSSGDPFFGAVTPVTGTDYTQLTGTTVITISRTSGQSVIITLADSGGGSSIQGLQLRANPVTVTNTTQTSAFDDASQTAYGVRGTGGTGPSQSANLPGITADCPPGDAAAVAQILISNYAQRRPILALPVYNASSSRLTQILARNLSDRVTVIDSVTGMNADCFIERLEYTWNQGGRVLKAMLYCEKAPTWPVTPFIFDDPVYGRFNTGGGFGL